MLRAGLAAARALLLVGLVACGGGGDGPAAPEAPRYPAVAGSYNVTGQFDRIPGGQIVGTLVIIQPSRARPQLSGSAQISAPGLGAGVAELPLSNAIVSEQGEIAFNYGPADQATTWRFTGTLSPSGEIISGVHVLQSTDSRFTGDWMAARRLQ